MSDPTVSGQPAEDSRTDAATPPGSAPAVPVPVTPITDSGAAVAGANAAAAPPALGAADAAAGAAAPVTAPGTATAPGTDPIAGPPRPPVATPTERVLRGVLLSLLVIPIGATLWVILWNFNFIASIVAFAIAWGAVSLYRLGSGANTVTRGAFWSLIGVILVAMVVSFLAAIGSDFVSAFGLTTMQALTSEEFWATYWNTVLTDGEMWAAYMPDLVMSVIFAGLGCFGTIRRLSRESRAQ